jgi:hypothetical protein
MEAQVYYRELPVPAKFEPVAELIQHPLQPRLDLAPREKVVALGSWWTGLSLEDRVEFAYFYALWCARARVFGK